MKLQMKAAKSDLVFKMVDSFNKNTVHVTVTWKILNTNKCIVNQQSYYYHLLYLADTAGVYGSEGVYASKDDLATIVSFMTKLKRNAAIKIPDDSEQVNFFETILEKQLICVMEESVNLTLFFDFYIFLCYNMGTFRTFIWY